MMKSEKLFQEAVKYIPGGVNSPVRAFGSVGLTPRFIERADGSHMYDVDGNQYIDFIGSWGPMILGHNHPAVRESVIKACESGLSFGAATEREVEMAALICEIVPSIERCPPSTIILEAYRSCLTSWEMRLQPLS